MDVYLRMVFMRMVIMRMVAMIPLGQSWQVVENNPYENIPAGHIAHYGENHSKGGRLS